MKPIVIEGRMGALGRSRSGRSLLLRRNHHRGEIYLHEGGTVGFTSSEEEVVALSQSAYLRVSILFPLGHLNIITPLLPFNINTKFYSHTPAHNLQSITPTSVSPAPSLIRHII